MPFVYDGTRLLATGGVVARKRSLDVVGDHFACDDSALNRRSLLKLGTVKGSYALVLRC